MRLNVLVPALLLAGCAAQKLEAPTSGAYGAALDLSPSAEETAVLAGLAAALQRGGLPAASTDPAVMAATRARCNALLTPVEDKTPGSADTARALLAAGVADTSYEVLDVTGGWAKHELSGEELDGLAKKIGKTDAPLLAGACVAENGMISERYFGLTVVRRYVDLKAPRAIATGGSGSVSASVSAGVKDAVLYLSGPGADAMPQQADGLSSTVNASGPGTVLAEVVGTVDGRRTLLARAAIGVPEASSFPADPPKDAEPVKTAADAAAAVQKVIDTLHGGTVAADDAAKALAESEAKGRVADEPQPAAATAAGAELMSLRVAPADLAYTLGVMAQSPWLRKVARDRAVAVGVVKAAKGGDLGVALLVAPPAAVPAPAAAPAPVEPAAPAGDAAPQAAPAN